MMIGIPEGIVAAVSLVAGLLFGTRGPAFERHGRGLLGRFPLPLSLPDLIWTGPLCVAVAALFSGKYAFHRHHDWAYWMGIVSFVLALLLVVEHRVLSSGIRDLPYHLQFLADYGHHGSVWRSLMRACVWQGLLLILPSTQATVARLPWLLLLPGAFLGCVAFSLVYYGRDVIATIRWFRDPFVDIQEASTCDWFISYKSDQANDVRALTDRLVASGQRVWFAEYMIRFLARDQFQPAIDAGIAGCRHGLLCTSKRFAESQHCMNELAQLLKRFKAGEIDLRELRFDGATAVRHQYATELASAKLLEHQGDMAEALRFLEVPSSTGIDGQISAEVVEVTAPSFGFHLRFESSNWDEIMAGEEHLGPERRFVARYRKRGGRARCELRITASFFTDPITRLLGAATMPLPNLDLVQMAKGVPIARIEDRSLCSALRNFEMIRTAKAGERCIGFHLVHRLNEGGSGEVRGYPLLTIWARRAWIRRCYLVFPTARAGQEIQFRLDFVYFGPLHQFLNDTSEFDQIIKTLRMTELGAPSPHVLPREEPRSESIPVLEVLSQMNEEAQGCPGAMLPKVLANQAFYLVEMANESSAQREELYWMAISRLNQAIALRPGYAHAYQEKAYIYSRVRDYHQAFLASEEAVRAEPGNPKYRTTWIAIQLDAMAHSAEPVTWCRPVAELGREVDRLLAEFPDYPSAAFEKARLLVLQGAPQSAWEGCLAEAGRRYRSLLVMPSGKAPTTKDVISTMIQNTIVCCALSDRVGQIN